MPEFKVLYYPEFEPPEIWLRSYLLFYDKINTIIPEEVRNPFSFNISHFLDELPNTIEGISPRQKEINFDENALIVLERAFETIKNQKTNKKDEMKFTFFPNGMSFGGDYTTIHKKKFSFQVTELLEKYDLFWKDRDNFVKHMEKRGIQYPTLNESQIVNADAGHLILSLIADNVGRNYGLNTITYKNLDFAVNELLSLNFQRKNIGKSSLISSMIRCEIPNDITKLSIDEYKEIRERYSGIKREFHSTINELNMLFDIDKIEDPEILERRVKELTNDFNTQFEKFQREQIFRKIKKWTPFYVKTFCKTIGIFVSGSWSLNASNSVVGIASEIIPNIFPIQEIPHEKHLRLLANLQKDILDSAEIKKLYSPPYYF